MGNDFRNLTAKVLANLDNPIKSYEFSKRLCSHQHERFPSQFKIFAVLQLGTKCHNIPTCFVYWPVVQSDCFQTNQESVTRLAARTRKNQYDR